MSTQTDLEAKAKRFFMAWPNGGIPAMLAAFARSLTQPMKGIVLEPTPITDAEALQMLKAGNTPMFVRRQPKEGLTADNERLRALVQELLEALDQEAFGYGQVNELGDYVLTVNAFKSAKEQGFTPTKPRGPFQAKEALP